MGLFSSSKFPVPGKIADHPETVFANREVLRYIVITEKLNSDETRQFFNKISEQKYPGRGRDLSRREINNRYETLKNILKEIKE